MALVQAQTLSCSANGYTVVFVNGVFDTKTEAQIDANSLGFKLGPTYNSQPVTVQLGYNPTHLAGAGDLLQSFAQQFNSSLTDYDLDTILMQIYPEVTTRKLLVVGHSQGAQYANEIYSYLLAHGEPKEAVGVYAVATPASFVVGGGKYLTSTTDKVISDVSAAVSVGNSLGAHTPLPLAPNTTLELSAADEASEIGGHSFTDTYLAQAAPQITNDIDSELGALVPTDASAIGDCFTPPDASAAYKAQQVAFAVADPAATVLKVGAATTLQVGAVALKAAGTFAQGMMQMVADAITLTAAPPSDAVATQKTDTIVDKLYGSSLDGLSAQDKKDLLGSDQGGAAALAVTPPKATVLPGVVLGTSTQASTVATSSAPKSIFPYSSNGIVMGGGGGSVTPVAVVTVAEDDAAVVPDESSSTPDVVDNSDASSTLPVDDASSTPPMPPAPPIPALPTGAPVTDNFDTYDGSGWSVIPTPNNTIVHFGADDGTVDPFRDASTTSSDCHSGGCIIATGGAGGLGGFGYESFMYKESGVGQDSGAFTIWARARQAGHYTPASVGLCAGVSLGCSGQNAYWFNPFVPQDDTWHEYYVAWRQGSSSIETCVLQDNTTASDCVWNPINFPLGTQFDGILLAGGVARPDMGDQVWFDDLGEATTQ